MALEWPIGGKEEAGERAGKGPQKQTPKSHTMMVPTLQEIHPDYHGIS